MGTDVPIFALPPDPVYGGRVPVGFCNISGAQNLSSFYRFIPGHWALAWWKIEADAVPHLRLRLPNKRSRYKIGQAKSSKFPFWRGGGSLWIRRRWISKVRRTKETAAAAIFAYLGPQWPGGNSDTHSNFRAPEILRNFSGGTPVNGVQGRGDLEHRNGAPRSKPLVALWLLSVHTESNPPRTAPAGAFRSATAA